MLQSYPLENVGGMGRILQLAYDLSVQREREKQAAVAPTTASGLGARLRNTVWRTTPVPSTAATSAPVPTRVPAPALPSEPEDSSDDSSDSDSDYDEVQTVEVPSNADRTNLTTRLANTVWKGITNQSAMEAPPTPTTPSPLPSPRLEPRSSSPNIIEQQQPVTDASGSRGSSIWGYAEKLRDSDAAATLAKVSTNWRVKALDAWSKRGSVAPPNSAPLGPSSTLSPSWTPSTPASRSAGADDYDMRRSSLPLMDRSDMYSPPARPAFFRPPRDSIIIDPKRDMMASLASPTGSDMSAHSEGDIDHLRRSTIAAVSSRTPSPRSATLTRSGGPKPLLLGSHTVVAHSRSPTLPAVVLDHQFADAVRAKRPSVTHRTSQSSMSSMSPSDRAITGRTRTSDIGSRVVPINRARSPMAMARDRRQESMSSATSSPGAREWRLPSDSGTEAPQNQRKAGWRTADARDSTASAVSLPSPPPPSSPEQTSHDEARVAPTEGHRGSVVLGEFGELDSPLQTENTPKVSRKTNSSLTRLQIEESSDSSPIANLPARTSRVKSKRYPPRLANLRNREAGRASTAPVPAAERATSPNTLAAEWPEEGDATTPKASTFDPNSTPSSKRVRKNSGEGRTRKISADGASGRTRKTSADGRDAKERRVRDSAAVEGDDEGYDEFLSAYESEDSGVAH